MKNNFKKGMSVLIAVAMIGSIPTVSAFATDSSTLNITSENFKSERTVVEGRTKGNPYESAINDMVDGVTKTKLLSLLSELNEIKEAEREALIGITDKDEKQSIKDKYKASINEAKAALKSAIEEAGIELPSRLEGKISMKGGGYRGFGFYENEINALEDGVTKTELLSLLSELNKIREEEKEELVGITDEVEKQSIEDTYKVAIDEAKDALKSALEEAGIELTSAQKGRKGK